MREIYIFSAVLAAALSATAVRAEFSEEWVAYAAEIEAECASFAESIAGQPAWDAAPRTEFSYPRWPRGYPARPHICVWLQFDVDPDGKPVNIKTEFRAPSNVGYGFVREATNAAKKWRYQLPETPPKGLSGLYAGFTFEPVDGEAWTATVTLQSPSSSGHGYR